ncbi:MAG: small subunit ribosomal protein [Solirubrobacteraceae bacterium]|jgi:small subunit ribosomal protein S6|nr:small subunit ribosomal protein [Solirubrobacteraceae bacterium]
MAAIDPLYDLVLMLDSAAPDDQRAKVLSGVEQTIGTAGEIVNRQDWGVRQTAYEIRHKTDAEYHLLQFHATREVLERLQRTLRITDGVVRFRIIKLKPGTPAPPASRPEPRPTGIVEAPPAGAEPVAVAAAAEPEAEAVPDAPEAPVVPAGDAE